MVAKLRVTQVRSTISHIARNRATVRALGLKRIGHTVEVPDNDATRGMVRQVRFLVSVEEVPGTSKDAAASQASSGRGGGVRTKHKPSEGRGDGKASSSHRSEDGEEKA
jgi:large subunit ribosomal protein L30